ncbi:MAG: hypothetical protein LM563_03570 [Thermofilum sp.]|nr:hypothetical protein [Thermofilum sp.]
MSWGRRGLGWLLQAVTGALLVVLISAHIVRVHLEGSYKGLPTYQDVLSAFKNPLIVAAELALSFSVIYHAMYGLYMVVVEAGLLGERRARALFTVAGVALAVYTLAVTAYLALKP